MARFAIALMGVCSLVASALANTYEGRVPVVTTMPPPPIVKKPDAITPAPKCTPEFKRCAGAPDYELIPYIGCCGDLACLKADWLGWGKHCVPAPPKCYQIGQRCHGSEGKEYVPYAKCCSKTAECMPADNDWGSFCVEKTGPKKAPKANKTEAPVMSEEYEKEAPETKAPGITKTDETEAPKSKAPKQNTYKTDAPEPKYKEDVVSPALSWLQRGY